MKQTIYFAVLSIFFLSCSSDDENSDDDFFNLNTGNLRVYKRFYSPDDITFTPSNRIDSVRTTGDTIIDGTTYEKFQHRIYNAATFSETYTEALRKDQNGHLVNDTGFVLHPGYDMDYTYIRQFFVGDFHIGNINYHLQVPVSIAVDGQPFYVYPYRGDYVPLNPAEPQQYIFDWYQPGIGLVNQHCSIVFGTSAYEDRLIYYDVN
jgi:hypothetical protein